MSPNKKEVEDELKIKLVYNNDYEKLVEIMIYKFNFRPNN